MKIFCFIFYARYQKGHKWWCPTTTKKKKSNLENIRSGQKVPRWHGEYFFLILRLRTRVSVSTKKKRLCADMGFRWIVRVLYRVLAFSRLPLDFLHWTIKLLMSAEMQMVSLLSSMLTIKVLLWCVHKLHVTRFFFFLMDTENPWESSRNVDPFKNSLRYNAGMWPRSQP